MRQDFSRRMIGNHDSRGQLFALDTGLFAGELFEARLQLCVERQLDRRFSRMRSRFCFRQMRREFWKGLPHRRHALALRFQSFSGRNDAGFDGAVEHAITRPLRRLRIAIEAAHFRRLRKSDKQRRFTDRQAPRLLAEIRDRCRTHAFEIAAERRQSQVQPQNFVFRQCPFELNCARHLAQLPASRALMLALKQARDLHGQRRAARDEALMLRHLHDGARDRLRVDAVMLVKPLILECEQHFQVVLVDVFRVQRQAPLSIGRRKGAQQAVFAINNGDGNFLRRLKRQRSNLSDRFGINAIRRRTAENAQPDRCETQFANREAFTRTLRLPSGRGMG